LPNVCSRERIFKYIQILLALAALWLRNSEISTHSTDYILMKISNQIFNFHQNFM